jgi:DNA-binding beta-propeller fold protein YncE
VNLAGLASDRHGNLYVVDSVNNRVNKLSAAGKWLASWRFSGSPLGLSVGPGGLTVDRQGDVFMPVSGNDSVQKIVPSKGAVATWSKLGAPAARVNEPHSVAIDRQGNVFVITGSSRNHVLKFSAHGVLLSDWGPSVLRQAGMYVLAGLTTDRQGNLYASDALNNRLYKLSSTGRLLARWKVNELHSPSSHRTSAEPYGIAVDSHGEIYVADVGDQALKKLSPDGKYLDQAILPGVPNSGTHETCSDCALPDPKLITPREVAVDRNGVTYLLDSDHHIVVKLSSSGKVLSLWGSKGSASGALKSPVRLAVDRRGDVFVLDAAQNKVFEYSPQGDLLAHWGGKGSNPGQLLSPDGIGVDSAGNVYVADTGNNRLQRLLLGR